jgi:hypothetical protein
MIKKFESFGGNKITKNLVYEVIDAFVELEEYDPIINIGFWTEGDKQRAYAQTYYEIKTGEIPNFDLIEDMSRRNKKLNPYFEWQFTLQSEFDKIEDKRIFEIMKKVDEALNRCGKNYSFKTWISGSNFSDRILILNFSIFGEL